MKRFLLYTMIILALMLAAACSSVSTQQTSEFIADEITISKSISSFMFVTKSDGTDTDLINELSSDYKELTVEPTEDKMDVISMYIVAFHKNGELTGTISVDKNGVIWINGSTDSFRQTGGNFGYSRIEEIVNNARQEGNN